MGAVKTTFRGGKACGCSHDPCAHSFGGSAEAHADLAMPDLTHITSHPSFAVATASLHKGHWSGFGSSEDRDVHATMVRSANVIRQNLNRKVGDSDGS